MADGAREIEFIDAHELGEALRMSARSVRRRAEREAWPCDTRTGIGGRQRVYALNSLPVEVRESLLRHRALRATEAAASAAAREGQQAGRRLAMAGAIDQAVEQRTRETGQAAAAALQGKARQRMDAKLQLLGLLRAFAASRQCGLCQAMEEFCDAYNSGALNVDPWVRNHTGVDLHPGTLRRWRRLVKQAGPQALAGVYGNRKGTGCIDTQPALRDFILGVLREQPHISAKVMHDAIAARLPDLLPQRRTLERWLARWKQDNAELLLACTNPDAWKNRYMPAFGKVSEGIVRANQLWELDSTPADVLLADGRYSLIGLLDVATRQLRLHVSRTSTAAAVCQILRRGILELGVPEAVKMDNGRDYASKHVAGVLAGLEIEARFSAPFSPWQKPHIERAFRTFSHDLLEILPGYVGHNVAEAQGIRARKAFSEQLFQKGREVELRMTAAELQQFCDDWTRDVYGRAAHSGLGGISPFQKSIELAGMVRRVGDVRALDLLLGAGTVATVQKKGIRYNGHTYIAAELGEAMRQQVLVRQDDSDLGRLFVYFDERFLCIAECPEITGVSRQDVAARVRSERAETLRTTKAHMRKLGSKANQSELARDIAADKRRAAAKVAALPNSNVVQLDTPALRAATEAAEALEQWQTPEARQAQAQQEQALSDVVSIVRRKQTEDETWEQRFEWALKQLMIPAAERNPFEAARLRDYQSTPEFLSRWQFFEEFGPGTFGLGDDYCALLPEDAPYLSKGT